MIPEQRPAHDWTPSPPGAIRERLPLDERKSADQCPRAVEGKQ